MNLSLLLSQNSMRETKLWRLQDPRLPLVNSGVFFEVCPIGGEGKLLNLGLAGPLPIPSIVLS